MIVMRFTIELDIGLSYVLQFAPPPASDRSRDETHRRGRSKRIVWGTSMAAWRPRVVCVWRASGSPFSGWGLPGLDGSAWCHPRRLTIDSGAVAAGDPNPARRSWASEPRTGMTCRSASAWQTWCQTRNRFSRPVGLLSPGDDVIARKLPVLGRRTMQTHDPTARVKRPADEAFSRAAEGIRTLELLHGKQNAGLGAARNIPANRPLLPHERVPPMSGSHRGITGVSGLGRGPMPVGVRAGRRATAGPSRRRGRGAGRRGRGLSALWRVAGCRPSVRRA
jgi:hypothetical protein